MAPSAVYIEEQTHLSLAALPIPSIDVLKNISQAEQKEIYESVAFGGDDQWQYDPNTKRFDLSRGSRTKLVIDADDGIRNHRGCMIVGPLTSPPVQAHATSTNGSSTGP